MRIDVTQEDIDAGEQRDNENCPTARAIRRRIGANRIVRVLARSVVIGLRQEKYELPVVVQTFVTRFDAGNAVAPFSFDLDL